MSRETAYINATIHTVDDMDTTAEAILIRDGRIAVVGTSSEVLGAAEPRCLVYDGAGATIVPGFVDPHNHLSQTMLAPASLDFLAQPPSTLDDALEAISAFARDLPADRWVRASGFWPDVLREGRGPTRLELDEAVADNPVFIIDVSCHRGWVNSRGLAAAGIDDHTPHPAGGFIEKDSAGIPTGLLLEGAVDPVQSASWRGLTSDPALSVQLLRHQLEEYAAVGITALCDAAVTPDFAELYARADREAQLPLTVRQLHTGDDFFGRHDLRRRDFLKRVFDRESDRLRGGSMKIFIDHGFPDGPALERVHDGCRHHSGTTWYGRDQLKELATSAASLGVQTAIHAMGNWSVDAALDAYEGVRRSTSDGRLLRIEHMFVGEPAGQAPRMSELGVDLVSKPGLLHHTGSLFSDVWRGHGQAQLAVMPVRSMLEAGVRVSFGSDAPAGPVRPADILWGAVSRMSSDGRVIDPEEAVSAAQALRCSTINAAHAAGLDEQEGSIEVGKRANLAVLDRDILACPTDEIRDMEVVATIVDGRTVHDTSKAPALAVAG